MMIRNPIELLRIPGKVEYFLYSDLRLVSYLNF